MGVNDVRAAALGAASAAIAAERSAAQGEQLGLLDVPEGRFLTDDEARQIGQKRRGPGRPKGAENLVTRDLRRILLAADETPQQWMLRWSSLEPEELARRLGCTRAEAFDRILRVKDALAPYVMPRMAPVDDKGQAVPQVTLVVGGHAGSPEASRAPWLRTIEAEAEIVENQALSSSALPPANANASGGGE